jgi:hypothetical protein
MTTNKTIPCYNPNDTAKTTQTLQQYDITNFTGNKTIQAHLNDLANITNRQGTNIPFNTFIKNNIASTTQLQDEIKTTIKQTINYNDHLQPVSNKTLQTSINVTNWEAPITLKDKVKLENYVGSIGLNCENVNEINYRNANTNISKEEIFIGTGREPTTSNYNIGPNIELIQNIKMNDKINIDRTSNATMSNLNIERVERNQEIKTNVSYNDRIEIS